MEKHLTFFKEISSPQKRVVIFTNSSGSDKDMIHGLYSKFFTVNSLGTKSFSLVTNFLIFSVHSWLIQNNHFSTFSTSASLVMQNIWVEGMHSGSNFFRKANVQLNQNPHLQRILTTIKLSSDARPKTVARVLWQNLFLCIRTVEEFRLFFEKNEFSALILSVFSKELFLTCKISQKRTQLRAFIAFSIYKM